jgi:hypothetical protein
MQQPGNVIDFEHSEASQTTPQETALRVQLDNQASHKGWRWQVAIRSIFSARPPFRMTAALRGTVTRLPLLQDHLKSFRRQPFSFCSTMW